MRPILTCDWTHTADSRSHLQKKILPIGLHLKSHIATRHFIYLNLSIFFTTVILDIHGTALEALTNFVNLSFCVIPFKINFNNFNTHMLRHNCSDLIARFYLPLIPTPANLCIYKHAIILSPGKHCKHLLN